MCAVAYTWDTSRCAAQQCANMKRHIRVIGASQHVLLSIISISRRFTGSAVQVQRGTRRQRGKGEREAKASGCCLHCRQHGEQAKNALRTCSSWLDIRRCLKSPPNTITPSHTRVRQPGPPCHSEPTARLKKLFHLTAPNIRACLNFHLVKTIFRLNFDVY